MLTRWEWMDSEMSCDVLLISNMSKEHQNAARTDKSVFMNLTSSFSLCKTHSMQMELGSHKKITGRENKGPQEPLLLPNASNSSEEF